MEFKDQLKSQLDIVDVIGQYVRLKAGSPGSFKGLCPFHSEKTPSFHVHRDHQFYHCFGCHASGDVFRFVMQHDQLTFPEALRLLADRYGIPMPERSRAGDPQGQVREALLEMHEIAADLFVHNLRGPAGGEVRGYLEERGVAADAIAEFRLGFADRSGQQLANRLRKFGPALLAESGLVNQRDDGSFYDRFRGRLIFPIHNEGGKVVAFGGRALGKDEQPKYLNSSETKLYRKSAILYNLHRAKQEARRQQRVVLVEGYLDAIAVYGASVKEVVAPCGTALTSDHVRAIRRHLMLSQSSPGEVLVNFDADGAGAQAAERSIQLLLSEGMRVKVVELPEGHDPDDFIRVKGKDNYVARLVSATSYFHWLADRARARFDTTAAAGRVDAFRSLLPALKEIPDRLERASVAVELAESLQVPREWIDDHLRRANGRHAEAAKAIAVSATVPPSERLLLRCLLLSEEARGTVLPSLRDSVALEHVVLRPAFAAMLDLDAAGVPFSLEGVLERVDQRVQRIVAELSFAEGGISPEQAAGQALDCLRALEYTSREAERAALRRTIKELERAGRLEEALALSARFDERHARTPLR